jgi:hypothetical protein
MFDRQLLDRLAQAIEYRFRDSQFQGPLKTATFNRLFQAFHLRADISATPGFFSGRIKNSFAIWSANNAVKLLFGQYLFAAQTASLRNFAHFGHFDTSGMVV